MPGWLIRMSTGIKRSGAATPSEADAAGGRTTRPRFRLIALPHAGGWPSAFRTWRHVLPDDVEFVVGQLPGRGARIDEPAERRIAPLVEGLSGAVAELDPLPSAIIGHSFGSVLGFELAKAMERNGQAPRLLAVSARQPPCFPSMPPFAYLRSDADLLAHLVDLGGISPELINRTELVRLALTAIRADLEAMETYGRPMSGTAVPILALGAVDDPVVVAERLHLWCLETTGPFARLMFTGGHHYLYTPENAASIAAHLIARLNGGLDDGPAHTGDQSLLRSLL